MMKKLIDQRPCSHPEPVAGCKTCWRMRHDAIFAQAFGGVATHPLDEANKPEAAGIDPIPPPPEPERIPCVHRSKDPFRIPSVRPYYTCALGLGQEKGPDKIKLVCECRPQPGGCIDCPSDPRNAPREWTRNLLFHMYPLRNGPILQRWKWHAEQLRKRATHFNGRKVIAIATGEGLDHPEAVKALLPASLGFEFIEFANNPDRREVASFLPLMQTLAADPTHVTLYAHSKGVTRDAGVQSHRWAEILYDTNVDHWGAVEKLLRKFPLVGAFKKVGKGFKNSRSQWHFSGSWMWFKNAEMLARNWQEIDEFWGGIESWPSLHFAANEAACLFHEGKQETMQLYDHKYMTEKVEPALKKWQAEHVGDRSQIEYTEPPMVCRACGSSYTHFLYCDTPDSKRGNWWRCLSCGCDTSDSVYAELLPRYLDPKYHSHAIDELGTMDAAIEQMTTNLDLFGKGFDERLNQKTFLDVGCSEGAAMLGMRRRGWNVHGWDIVAAVRGLDNGEYHAAFSPEFTADVFSGQRFDAILCREVIEHVPEWKSLLAAMTAALQPGGLLQIQTPHPWHEPNPLPYQDYHLQIFTPTFLCAWVEKWCLLRRVEYLQWPHGWCAVFRKVGDNA